jgi:hypothetical protein
MGELHERLFQRGLVGRQLVEDQAVASGGLADLIGGQAFDFEHSTLIA